MRARRHRKRRAAFAPTRLGQLSMIAIGGAIGTGLFLGSSLAVRIAGPGVIVSYLIGAVIALLFMGALSEMAVAHPTAGSFGVYAELYVNRLGGLHGPLHLLGGAMHRHRRRSDGHRDLLPVVVPEHAEMALDSGILVSLCCTSTRAVWAASAALNIGSR